MPEKSFLTLLYSADHQPESPANFGDAFLETLSQSQKKPADEFGQLNSSYLIRDNDYRLLELMNELPQKRTPEELSDQLRRVIALLGHVSADTRLPIFRKFNLLLTRLLRKHADSQPLFLTCAEVVVLLKKQMESCKQSQPSASKLEWVELEKAVYHLSLWEDSVNVTVQELHS